MRRRRNSLTSQMIATTGLLSAVCLVMLFIAGIIPSGWTGMTAVSGLAVAVAVAAIGYTSGVLCYAVSGLLALLLIPAKHVAVLFLCFFGIYPILKCLLERLKNRFAEILLKILFCEAVAYLLYRLAYGMFFQAYAQTWTMSVPFAPVLFTVCGIVFLFYDYAFTKIMSMLQVRLIPFLRKQFSLR